MSDEMETLQVRIPKRYAPWFRSVIQLLTPPDDVGPNDAAVVIVSFTHTGRIGSRSSCSLVFNPGPGSGSLLGVARMAAAMGGAASKISQSMYALQITAGPGNAPEVLAEYAKWYEASVNRTPGIGRTIEEATESAGPDVFGTGGGS